jgi:hypothetical protein
MLTRWRSLLDTLGLSTFADIVHSTDIAIQSLRSRQHYFDSVRLLLLGAPKHVARVTNKLKMKRSSLTAGRRADLHVVTGVSSYYAVIPSALQKSDEPMWQSRKKASLDESYPSTTPTQHHRLARVGTNTQKAHWSATSPRARAERPIHQLMT